MADLDHVAVARVLVQPAGGDDDAVAGSAHAVRLEHRDVDPGVEKAPALAERGLERAAKRHGEAVRSPDQPLGCAGAVRIGSERGGGERTSAKSRRGERGEARQALG